MEGAAETPWLVFAGASLLLIVAPGPDILFLTAQGVQGGRRAGLLTALGLSAGNLVHTCAAALGVSVIFRTSPTAFSLLKAAGVAYLLMLAARLLWPPRPTEAQESAVAPAGGTLFWRGFAMNVLNPKVALFFLAFLPQFVPSDSLAPGLHMLALGLLFAVLTAGVFCPVGLLAGSIRPILERTGGGRRLFAWIAAGVYLLLALRLAVAR